MKDWSEKYQRCIECGSDNEIHVARGLCKTCYSRDIENAHKNYIRNKRGVAEKFLTKEKLIELYIEKEMSLSDIGKLAGTTRQNIYYKLKRYNIKTRSKKKSRTLALDKGKIKHSFINEDGNLEVKTLNKIRFNEKFFDYWTNEMAYILGLIYTDGNVDCRNLKKANSKGSYVQGRLTFSQKEIELVEKMLKLMDCDVKISFRKKRELKDTVAGEMYYFSINSNKLFKRLQELGVNPNKSLNLKFPIIPREYIRHFIRGCWDGDGTVYIEKNGGLRAGFVSGSLEFIKTLKNHLEFHGLSSQKLHTINKGKGYYFRYNSLNDCSLLFSYLYRGVNSDQYLQRKFQIFKDYFE